MPARSPSRSRSPSRKRSRRRRRSDSSRSRSSGRPRRSRSPWRRRDRDSRSHSRGAQKRRERSPLRAPRSRSTSPPRSHLALSAIEAKTAVQAAVAIAAAAAVHAHASRSQREVYVGNLVTGLVTPALLTQLFNVSLAPLLPPSALPAVLSCRLDPAGKFAFVELRTEALAGSALAVDGALLCGRSLKVGRPKGYTHGVPPVPSAASARPPPAFEESAFADAVVLLCNLLPTAQLLRASERAELCSDVAEECARFGQVLAVAVPPPPPGAPAARCYVAFALPSQALQAARAMHGRFFDGNVVQAAPVSRDELAAAQRGEWTPS